MIYLLEIHLSHTSCLYSRFLQIDLFIICSDIFLVIEVKLSYPFDILKVFALSRPLESVSLKLLKTIAYG